MFNDSFTKAGFGLCHEVLTPDFYFLMNQMVLSGQIVSDKPESWSVSGFISSDTITWVTQPSHSS